MMYYLAYGSNLSVAQMAWRCPHARMVGTAEIEGHRLAFRTHATIEPCVGRRVPVLVWEIDEEDERSLDRYEGFPHYYVKRDFDVRLEPFGDPEGSERVTAMAYVMVQGSKRACEPSRGYLATIDAGYRTFGFDTRELDAALEECEALRRTAR